MRLMPQAQRKATREVRPGSATGSLDDEIRRLAMENQLLEQRLGRSRVDPRLTRGLSQAQPPTVRPPTVPGPVGSASPSYEALRRELLRIRARERQILRRLQMLSVRNPRFFGRGRMPSSRNVFLGRQPITRRINFRNTPRIASRRTLTGSVGRGIVPDSRRRFF
jgi:hypothetical protein